MYTSLLHMGVVTYEVQKGAEDPLEVELQKSCQLM